MTAFLYPISIFNMVKKSKGKDKRKKQRISNKLLIFRSCCTTPTPTPIVPLLFALWHFPSKNSKDSFHVVYPKKQNNKIILFWFDNWLPQGKFLPVLLLSWSSILRWWTISAWENGIFIVVGFPGKFLTIKNK